jgi:predicted ATP-dependent endonuclease of OLD family
MRVGQGHREAVVLVEGISDQLALHALARRRGRNLLDEGISVIPMGGSKNIARFLDRYGPGGRDLRLAGLCDAKEEDDFRRALERGGIGAELDRAGMERLGFFVCEVDLEDELISALGVDAVKRVLGEMGELDAFSTLQRQPAWRGRPEPDQLRRFLGTNSGRKIRAAPRLVEALDLERVPRPLDRVLECV